MLLQIQGLCQRFNQMYALRDVHLALEAGEVHALVGENGAGKSTLIKILTGVYPLQQGEIRWQGLPLRLTGPADSLAAGIQVIHQERQLVPSFTAVENIYLGLPYEQRGPMIDRRAMKAKAQQLLSQLGLALDLERPAGELTPPEKTMVELARMMMRPCKLLILDEPTASLTDRETAVLFKTIKTLQRQGTAILYVSHRLDEIFQLTDQITALRGGQSVATVRTQDIDKGTLISLMTDALPPEEPAYRPLNDQPLLEVQDLSARDQTVREATLTVHSGEILGIFGLGGSGRTELLECIFGYRPRGGGQVTMQGQPLSKLSPHHSLDHGLVLISEERLGKALIPGMSVLDNTLLATLGDYSTGGWFAQRRARAAGEQMTEMLSIKGSPNQPVQELSGGNQQKVVFAKALLCQPKVYLCDEPTQAVDVKTRSEIHRLLRQEAASGKGVLFVSSDLQEMLEICHRMVIMSGGRTSELLENDGLTAEAVLAVCYEKEAMMT